MDPTDFGIPQEKNNNPTFIASHIPQVRKLLVLEVATSSTTC
jgi:hypothetical protein